jgi:hypothetical protein
VKQGGGKNKGATFERSVCKALGLWVTGGKRDDIFWRSAMSGGRATIRQRGGKETRHQAGDISSVHEAGHVLTSYWFIECKFVKNLRITNFVLQTGGGLMEYWRTAVDQARVHDRIPMVIAKQNRGQTIVVIPESERVKYGWARNACVATVLDAGCHAAILSFETMMECKPEFRTPVTTIERVRIRQR